MPAAGGSYLGNAFSHFCTVTVSFYPVHPLISLLLWRLGRGFEVILEFWSMKGASKFSMSWKAGLWGLLCKTVPDNTVLFMVYGNILCNAQPAWWYSAAVAQWTGLIEALVHILCLTNEEGGGGRENSRTFVELLLCQVLFQAPYMY